jgi:hypothetical protein
MFTKLFLLVALASAAVAMPTDTKAFFCHLVFGCPNLQEQAEFTHSAVGGFADGYPLTFSYSPNGDGHSGVLNSGVTALWFDYNTLGPLASLVPWINRYLQIGPIIQSRCPLGPAQCNNEYRAAGASGNFLAGDMTTVASVQAMNIEALGPNFEVVQDPGAPGACANQYCIVLKILNYNRHLFEVVPSGVGGGLFSTGMVPIAGLAVAPRYDDAPQWAAGLTGNGVLVSAADADTYGKTTQVDIARDLDDFDAERVFDVSRDPACQLVKATPPAAISEPGRCDQMVGNIDSFTDVGDMADDADNPWAGLDDIAEIFFSTYYGGDEGCFPELRDGKRSPPAPGSCGGGK